MALLGIIAAVVSVVAGGLSYKAAKDAQKEAKKAADEMSGVLINKDSNIEPIPVIYGERRIGGTRVYVHTEGGEKNQWLYMAIVLCEGPVEDIYDIEIDDYAIDEGRYGTIQDIDSSDPNRRIFRTQQVSGQPDWVYIEAYRGDDDQAASDILSNASNWGSSHKLSGVAYLAVRLQWDQDVFSSIPNITAVVKGKKVYDPRTDTTAWSDNPALCIRDYLINERYGKGLPSSAINDTAFEAAADDIESFTVTPYSGGPTGVQLFKCNAVIDTGKEIFKNLETMLLGCKGFLPYTNGQYALYIDQSIASSVMTLDTSTIIDGISIKSQRKDDKYNRVVCRFANPETKWEPDQAIWPDSGSTEETTFLTEDGDEILVEEIDLDTITDYYAARDIARILCLRSRDALRCGLTATSEALDLRIGDRVAITHPTPAWTAKPFQVEEVTLRYDGTVDLQLIEYDSSIYAYDTANEEHTYTDTDLPDPFSIEDPTGLTVTSTTRLQGDGTVVPAMSISWTAADDSFVDRYEVQWKQQSDSKYQSATTTDTEYEVAVVVESVTYDIRVRSINSVGMHGSWVTTTSTPVGDTTAPNTPTSLTAAGGYKQITLSWVNPTASDFKNVEIYVSDGGSYTQLGVSSGETFVHSLPLFNATRYYQIRSVDFSGNRSSFTSAVSATTEYITNSSFEDGVKALFEDQGLYAIENGSSLPSGYGAGDAGKLFFLTTDGKLYRWTGSAWTASVAELGDLNGSIVGYDHIVANTITGGLMATSGIITSTAQIGSAVIENANIKNGEVDTLTIAGSAVTVPVGTNATSSATLNTTMSQIGTLTVSWGSGVQPEAVSCVAGLSTFGGSANQTLSIQLRRVFGGGAYTSVQLGESFSSGEGGSTVIGGTFAITATAYNYVTMEIWANVSTGTKACGSYFINAVGAKR